MFEWEYEKRLSEWKSDSMGKWKKMTENVNEENGRMREWKTTEWLKKMIQWKNEKASEWKNVNTAEWVNEKGWMIEGNDWMKWMPEWVTEKATLWDNEKRLKVWKWKKWSNKRMTNDWRSEWKWLNE